MILNLNDDVVAEWSQFSQPKGGDWYQRRQGEQDSDERVI